MTPEGKVKKKIKAVLDNYSCHNIYVYMPVPGGFGQPTLDYLGFLYGRGFAIEAKRLKGKPTPRQEGTIEKISASGAQVFVVNDDASLRDLDDWLSLIVRMKQLRLP
jgi:hypothetical protein